MGRETQPSYMHSVSFRYMIKDVQESFGLSDAEVILLEQVRTDSQTESSCGTAKGRKREGERERERETERWREITSERNEQKRSSFKNWVHGVRNDMKWILLGVSVQMMLQSKFRAISRKTFPETRRVSLEMKGNEFTDASKLHSTTRWPLKPWIAKSVYTVYN